MAAKRPNKITAVIANAKIPGSSSGIRRPVIIEATSISEFIDLVNDTFTPADPIPPGYRRGADFEKAATRWLKTAADTAAAVITIE